MNIIRILTEKLFIIVLCLYNTNRYYPNENIVLYFLIATIISSLLEVANNKKVRLLIYIAFGLLSIYDLLFILYIPIIIYDLFREFKLYGIIVLSLVFIDFYPENLILTLFSSYISIIGIKEIETFEKNLETRDKIKEDSILLEKYNEQLKKDRKKNVHIAILTERNRIAKELHDAIGHTISSSILQVESIKIISKDEKVNEKLVILQDTLTKGMDDIRSSIHDLHNESLDLREQIEKLCSNVPNIDIELIYKVDDDLSYDLKYDILSVVKEGITNCSKHSNANQLKITLLEQPKFYTLVIKDNGSIFDNSSYKTGGGMGLLSIREIANKYNGLFNSGFDDGFKIHLTLMKG